MVDAITVDQVWKKFRLYHDRNQTLKAAIMRGRRARYEEFWALQDVSLEIKQGVTYGFIGTNGSGKSTLLKCLAKILTPEQGSTEVRGKMSALLELGAGFHPELSGRENVYLNGSILGMSKSELDRRFDDIVSFAGLERFIDTPVKNYSSGMYVRLGFSVAINVDPEVLLVDEVLAVGDEQFQRRCFERFADLKAEGCTIVLVSHALGSVQAVCDEAAWLDNGVLRETGLSGDVCAHYLSEVHEDRVSETHSTSARWGSGEVLLEELALVGEAGTPTRELHTGERVAVRFRYKAAKRIEKPLFVLGLHTVDGTLLTGPTSRDVHLIPDVIEGEGEVEVVIDSLPLLPGTFDLSIAVSDQAALRVYDQQDRVLRFDVQPGDPREGFGGLMTVRPQWRIDGTPAGPTP